MNSETASVLARYMVFFIDSLTSTHRRLLVHCIPGLPDLDQAGSLFYRRHRYQFRRGILARSRRRTPYCSLFGIAHSVWTERSVGTGVGCCHIRRTHVLRVHVRGAAHIVCDRSIIAHVSNGIVPLAPLPDQDAHVCNL